MLVLLILCIIGLLAFTSLRKMIEANRRIVHTHLAIEKLEDVLKILDDAETGQRGFLITGEPRYLEPYLPARAAAEQRLQEIAVLTRDNPRQRPRLDRLTMLVNKKFAELQETIDLRSGAGGFAAARAVVLSARGKQLMDDIRAVIAAMEQDENQLLARRESRAEASARATLVAIAIGLPLAILLCAVLAVLLTRHIAVPLRQMTAVAEQLARGDLAVALPAVHRADEVGVLGESFARMTGWLQQMAGIAGQIAEGDLDVTVVPQSERDQLGHAFTSMTRNLCTLTTELRQREEWLRVTLSSIGDAVITTDTTECVTFLNPAAESLTGWSQQDAVGQPIQQVFTIINELTRVQADDIVGRVLRERATVALANHTALLARDGREIAIEDSAAPITDSAGNVTGVVLVFHNVTERRRAQEAVREREAQLSTMLENLSEGVIACTIDGDVFQWNRAGLEMFGFDTLSEAQRNLPEFTDLFELRMLDGEIIPFEQWPLPRILRGEILLNWDIRVLRISTGVERVLSHNGSLVYGPDGQALMAVFTTTDMTERRRIEEQLRKLTATLEQQVQERTAQLTAANKELEAFSYSVSHDLRAPLRGIDGFTKILYEQYGRNFDAQGQDYLLRVRKAAQRMGQLIDDMLNFSRIGRREMQRAPVDLSELAAAVVAEMRQREPDRQVQVDIHPGLEVSGDAGLLRIVLDNLLGNAWKFTGKTADARIEVGALRQGAEQVFFVRDNGAGFDMAYAEKLFIPFQRLHSEEEFPGTGIGLAIVQRIIVRHGGRVWAEGEEGKGATIFFTLGVRSEK